MRRKSKIIFAAMAVLVSVALGLLTSLLFANGLEAADSLSSIIGFALATVTGAVGLASAYLQWRRAQSDHIGRAGGDKARTGRVVSTGQATAASGGFANSGMVDDSVNYGSAAIIGRDITAFGSGSVAISGDNVGIIRSETSRTPETVSRILHGYEERLHLLEAKEGPDSPTVADSLNQLAAAYQAAGEVDHAVKTYLDLVATLSNRLGREHPETLSAMSNLAGAYESAGKISKAIELYNEVIDRSRNVLGPDHPATLVSMNNLAGALRASGKIDQAVSLYENTLQDRIRVLGDRHPQTLGVRNNLAGAYLASGRISQAIELYEINLSTSELALGADSPQTLASRINLANAYESAGRRDRALRMFQESLSTALRLFGDDDVQTTAALEGVSRNSRPTS